MKTDDCRRKRLCLDVILTEMGHFMSSYYTFSSRIIIKKQNISENLHHSTLINNIKVSI